MAMGGILKFPGMEGNAARHLPAPPNNKPKLQRFDPAATEALYELSRSIYERALELVRFLDSDRAVAKQAGIEGVAIEVSAVLEGERFSAIVDTLWESVTKRRSAELTEEGIDRIHRMERLLVEASGAIGRYLGAGALGGQAEPRQALGNPASLTAVDDLLWVPLVIVGVVGLAGVAAAIFLKRDSRKASA